MRNIRFSESIVQKNPNISLGLVIAKKARVENSSDYFEAELTLLEKDLQEKFAASAPSENEIISATRRMYRSAGWEPTKYRPSSEALVRRLIKGKGLYKINNVVDFANLVSARYHIPLGLYDLEKIQGEITMDIGIEGEVYQGISKPVINAGGKIILRDDEGVFGNPTADSLRTSIQKETSQILTLFFIAQGISKGYITKMINHLILYYNLIADGNQIRSDIILI